MVSGPADLRPIDQVRDLIRVAESNKFYLIILEHPRVSSRKVGVSLLQPAHACGNHEDGSLYCFPHLVPQVPHKDHQVSYFVGYFATPSPAPLPLNLPIPKRAPTGTFCDYLASTWATWWRHWAPGPHTKLTPPPGSLV